MSVESNNRMIDHEVATMAVISSHMVIVYHKGEMLENLQRMLEMTSYAKYQISSSVFKPSLVFVLRDQSIEVKRLF